MNPHPRGMFLSFVVRDTYIRDIVKFVVPESSASVETDDRLNEFKEYVKYIERKNFNMSNTPEEYEDSMERAKQFIKTRADDLVGDTERDPYARIPASEGLAPFFLINDEELKISKISLTPEIRREVVDALAGHVFPPPEGCTNYEEHHRRSKKKVSYHEKIVFAQVDSQDEYYRKLALDIHRVKTSMQTAT